MDHITILSEDRVFSTLLSRNLQAQGYSVDIHLLNTQFPLSFLLSHGTWATSLWVLDLSWRDEMKGASYEILAKWCRTLPQPCILVIDDSWDRQHIRRFRSLSALRKPFPMTSFLRLVEKGVASGSPQYVGGVKEGGQEMEMRQRLDLAFDTWTPIYRRVVVPLDGSRLAESILPVVSTMASALSMEVLLLHVVPAEGQFAREPTPSQKEAIEDISEYLKRLAAVFKDQGVSAGWHVMVGDPVEAITRYAAQAPADLIAMSTHGMTGQSPSIMGSTAGAVLQMQTRPVLMIKPDQEIASL